MIACGDDRTYRVPYSRRGSIFGPEEVDAVGRLLASSATLSGGEERERFEQEFAEYVGTRHAIAVSSCTLALEIATKLLRLQPGDEIVTAPQTYQATINYLLRHPGPVRFCDIDPNSENLDPERLAEKLNNRTRAIYVTHYGGFPAEMDAIVEIARDRGIVVIEDAAHAVGAEFYGRKAGSLADIGCFSFTSFKNMSTLGQGGMLTFDRDEWLEPIIRLRSLEPIGEAARRDVRFGSYRRPERDLNRHAKNAYDEDWIEIHEIGNNATLSEPAAAVGRVQLRRLDAMNDRRRTIASTLNRRLSAIQGLRVQEAPPYLKHVYHLYTFFVDRSSGVNRDLFGAALEDAGIEIHLRFFPLHLLPEWRLKGHAFGECPVAERVWFEDHMNLPIYPALDDEQVEYMASTIEHVFENFL